jgi:protein gp37
MNDMSDWLGDWVPLTWQKEIIDYIKYCHWHRFYILTKHPLNLLKFSPWPDNCYVGTTVDTPNRYKEALVGIAGIKAKVKFISFEPLLGRMPLDMAYKFDNNDVQWVIIGACTGTRSHLAEIYKEGLPEGLKWPPKRLTDTKWALEPRREWVDEIIIAAKDAGVKVFLKDNLLPLMGEKMMAVKEIP